MVKTKEEVEKLLAILGETQEEIANTLTNLGIKGHRNSCRSCPIATYLHNNQCAEVVSVNGLRNEGTLFVGLYGVNMGDGQRYVFHYENMPQARGLIGFICAFDSGGYESLDVAVNPNLA